MFSSDPIDKAPRGLSRPERLAWASAYVEAYSYTDSVPEFYDEDAQLTATVVTKTVRQGCRGLSRLPALGDLVELGVFVRVDYFDPRDGRIWTEDGSSTSRQLLCWSRAARALVVAPRLREGACDLP